MLELWIHTLDGKPVRPATTDEVAEADAIDDLIAWPIIEVDGVSYLVVERIEWDAQDVRGDHSTRD
jgi:hypothetical protein